MDPNIPRTISVFAVLNAFKVSDDAHVVKSLSTSFIDLFLSETEARVLQNIV